ncbi:MAG: ribonuclease R [Sandaracinaceae bacterium]|nr:ribonuclease R [Sandaracinaceae bacterium]
MTNIDPDDVLRVLRTRAPRALQLGELQSRLFESPEAAKAARGELLAVLDTLCVSGAAQEMPGLRFRFKAPTPKEPPAPPAAGAKAGKPKNKMVVRDRKEARREERGAGGLGQGQDQGRRGGAPSFRDARSQPAPEAPRTPWQRPAARAASVAGYLTVTPRGFGFVAAEDGGPDVFVAPTAMGAALHGDKVEVVTQPSPKGREGQVVGILARRAPRVTGTLRGVGQRPYLEPDDLRLRGPLELVAPPPEGAKDGDVVDAQIVRFPQDAHERPGVMVEGVLGVQGITAVEVAKIKIRENVQEEFPAAVMAEAQAIPNRVSAADKQGREDLRDYDLCTIDPVDARDHDDALFIERLKGGGYHVIVAIADVSHYVRLGTAIDEEAQARCTSIYLPDRVIPMLPHEISSNLASLVPKRDRLCLAVDMTLDAQGRVTSHRYVEGLMRSRAKLTYGGVADALGLTETGGVKQPAARERLPMLEALLELSRVLRKKRLERGALDFDLPEARVKLDEQGEPLDVVRSRQDPGVREAYRVVEEMMLLANETVATDLSQRNIPAIYRTHGAPAVEKLETFCELATSLGEPLDPEAAQDPKQLTEFLARIEGEPAAPVLRYLLLRAMQQAIYDTNDVGHFGLAAKHYLHFTSPIRRYPDLAVHRVVRALARGEYVDGALLLPMLRKMAARSSQLERRAMTVERDVVALYRCLVMRDKVGEELHATISGLDESGFYASIDSPFVDVFVPCERLTDDYYAVDRLGVRLVGQRGGRVFEMGQAVTVRVASVNLERRRVEAELVGVDEERRRPGGRGRSRSPEGEESTGGSGKGGKREKSGHGGRGGARGGRSDGDGSGKRQGASGKGKGGAKGDKGTPKKGKGGGKAGGGKRKGKR